MQEVQQAETLVWNETEEGYTLDLSAFLAGLERLDIRLKAIPKWEVTQGLAAHPDARLLPFQLLHRACDAFLVAFQGINLIANAADGVVQKEGEPDPRYTFIREMFDAYAAILPTWNALTKQEWPPLDEVMCLVLLMGSYVNATMSTLIEMQKRSQNGRGLSQVLNEISAMMEAAVRQRDGQEPSQGEAPNIH